MNEQKRKELLVNVFIIVMSFRGWKIGANSTFYNLFYYHLDLKD